MDPSNVLSAHVDWITAVYPRDEILTMGIMLQSAGLFSSMRYAGHPGYDRGVMGSLGERVHWHSTRSSNHSIVVLPARALDALRRGPLGGVSGMLGAMPPLRFSRIDVAVDVDVRPPWGAVLHGLRSDIQKRAVVEPGVSVQTVYIGSSQSDRFMRIYDKGLERGLSDHQRQWFRLELVLRRARAEQVGRLDVNMDVGAHFVDIVNDYLQYVYKRRDPWKLPAASEVKLSPISRPVPNPSWWYEFVVPSLVSRLSVDDIRDMPIQWLDNLRKLRLALLSLRLEEEYKRRQ